MKGILIQVLVTIIVCLGQFFMSFSIAWPSYALEVLESDQSPIEYKISKNEANLIGSLPMLGSLIATPLSGWLSDAIGRKRTVILIALCFTLGWSLLATAKNVILILISRFIIGFGNGGSMVVSIPLVSEIGSDSTKGPLLTLLTFIYTIGTLASYIAGWQMSYQAVNYLALSLSVAFVVLLSFVRETPVYLISKKYEKEALKSLKFYRGSSKYTTEVLDEFDYLKRQHCSNSKHDEVTMNPEKEKLRQEDSKDPEMSAWNILFTSIPNRRGLVFVTINAILIVFGGTIGVVAYAGPLFSKGAPGLSKHMCSIVLSIAFVLGSALSTVANGTLKRRTVYISSAVFSSVILAVLASLLRWSWGPQWLVPAAVLAYSCVFQIGVGTVVFIQLGEIFLPKVKSLVTVIVIIAMSMANFTVLALFTPAVDTLGLDGTFLFFSAISAITAVVGYFTMKETKGVPLEEIQKMYEQGFLYRQ